MLSRLMTVREQVILFGLACSLIMGAIALRVYTREQVPGEPLTPENSQSALENTVPSSETRPAKNPAPARPEPALEPTPLVVAVMGAVQHESVYTFNEGQRVGDALARAGGTLETANLADINQAALLIDGTTLTIPYQHKAIRAAEAQKQYPLSSAINPWPYTHSGIGAGYEPVAVQAQPGPAPAANPQTATATRININAADTASLESLPGIGPALAARIIAYRQQHPFRSIEELMAVSGIGPKRFEALAPLVTIRKDP